jgi:two-component sensor histidine kinase
MLQRNIPTVKFRDNRDRVDLTLSVNFTPIMRNPFSPIINLGVRPELQPWEASITRKLNINALIGVGNMLVGLVVFYILGYHEFLPDIVFGMLLLPLTWMCNRYFNYVAGAYAFFGGGFLFFIPINLRMGMETFVVLFYFPLIISLIQYFGRKETVRHLATIFMLCTISVIIIALGTQLEWLHRDIAPESVSQLAAFNIVLSLTTTMIVTVVTTKEQIRQEQTIRNMLHEKEILLAEVFHRVKNNMNVITSLLNLQKHSTSDERVQEALEECRSRVYAMALVHDHVFQSGNLLTLQLGAYLQRLADDIASGMGTDSAALIHVQAKPIELEMSKVVPCGLIANELITNAFKHSGKSVDALNIQLTLSENNNSVQLIIQDNGNGIPPDRLQQSQTLGLELVRSLAEQIGGQLKFENRSGLCCTLEFPKV